MGKVNNYPRQRRHVKGRTKFQKIYGKSIKELAEEYGVSISTVFNNHHAGLPLGTLRNPHGGRRDNNNPKKRVEKWKINGSILKTNRV
ncbi:MAG: hypothetical protein ABIJ12_00415 [bacterium]